MKRSERTACSSGIMTALAVVLVLAAASHTGLPGLEPAADSSGGWPQFRGPDGQGVSPEKGLPTVWSATSPNVRWKTAIPGQGVSSPIVSKGRVFLTTSYRGSESGVADRAVLIATLGLLLFILVYGALTSRTRRDPSSPEASTTSPGFFGWVDPLIVGVAMLAFLVLSVAVALGPAYIDSLLAKIRQLLPPEREAGLIIWHIGNDAAIWLVSGLIALLGLAASFGWFRPGSAMRPLGAVVVVLAAAPFVHFTPLIENDDEIKLLKRVMFAVPALAMAGWYVLNYLRLLLWGRVSPPARTGRACLLGLATVLIAALEFVSPNFLGPQMGLQRVIVCLDFKSGKILWQTPVLSAPPEKKYHSNTYATPTPSTDGKYVVANFGPGLGCVDFDGRLLWTKEDPSYVENTRYGAGTSTVMTDEAVIAMQICEGPRRPPTWIAALEKGTGKELWRKEADYAKESYGTPLLVQRGGTTELIMSFSELVVGYDAKTGERLWSQTTPIQQQVSSLVRVGDVLCIGGGTAGDPFIVAMRLSGAGKDTKVEELWRDDDEDAAPGVSSPVVQDGKVYFVTDSGKLTCFDVLTGKRINSRRLAKGKYYACLLAAEGRIYALNHYGVTTVLTADSEMKPLAENTMGEQCYATPAIADGCILIRTDTRLLCIEKEAGSK